MVTQAEIVWGGGTGTIKFSDVAKQLYAVLPPLARLLLPASTIGKLIEKAVEEMKEYLKSNAEVSSIVEEQHKILNCL